MIDQASVNLCFEEPPRIRLYFRKEAETTVRDLLKNIDGIIQIGPSFPCDSPNVSKLELWGHPPQWQLAERIADTLTTAGLNIRRMISLSYIERLVDGPFTPTVNQSFEGHVSPLPNTP